MVRVPPLHERVTGVRFGVEMQRLCVDFGARMTRPFLRGRVQVCFRFLPLLRLVLQTLRKTLL